MGVLRRQQPGPGLVVRSSSCAAVVFPTSERQPCCEGDSYREARRERHCHQPRLRLRRRRSHASRRAGPGHDHRSRSGSACAAHRRGIRASLRHAGAEGRPSPNGPGSRCRVRSARTPCRTAEASRPEKCCLCAGITGPSGWPTRPRRGRATPEWRRPRLVRRGGAETDAAQVCRSVTLKFSGPADHQISRCNHQTQLPALKVVDSTRFSRFSRCSRCSTTTGSGWWS